MPRNSSIKDILYQVLNAIGRFLLGLVAFVICLLVWGFFKAFTVSPWINYLHSGDWVEVNDCVIVKPGDYIWPSKSYSEEFMPSVFYRYQWEGNTYFSRRVGFAPGRAWNRDDRSGFERENKPGTIRSCWINPEDPAEAVLVRTISMRYFSFNGLIAFVFMCATAIMGFWLWFGWLIKLYSKRPYRKIGYLRGR